METRHNVMLLCHALYAEIPEHMHVNTNQNFGCFHVGSGRVVSTDGVFHASTWPSEVDDALDAVDGTSMNRFVRVLEDVWVSDAADGGAKDGVLPSRCGLAWCLHRRLLS